MDPRQKKMEATNMNTTQAKTSKDIIQFKDKERNIYLVENDLLRPFFHVISIPGKNVRHNLVEALNYWLEIPGEKLQIITDIIFNFHNHAILIDDIQDGSALRRSAPTAHTIFGVANTINAATAIQAVNLDSTLSLNHPLATKRLTHSMLNMLAGQGMEIHWRDKFICPTEEEYLQMVNRKSAGLFYIANNLMQLFSTKNKNLDNLLKNIGLYIQVNDDYQNLKSEVYFDSKGFCEDLTEGKFGFPMVHAINSHPKEGARIIDILHQRTVDTELKKRGLSLIEACGSFEYTRNKIAEFKRTIFEEIDKLGSNPHMDEFFVQFIASGL